MSKQNAVFQGVDLQVRLNNRAHHTEEMGTERLVVRRGQPFSLLLQFKYATPQPLDKSLALILRLGKNGEVVVRMSGSGASHGKWWFSEKIAQSEVLLSVHSPADAPVGLYSLTVLLLSAGGQTIEQTTPQSFYLLYNPWCADDTVYMQDEGLLREYVLNENGILYQGSCDQIIPKHWNFGQFEKGVVDICFEILDNSPAALKSLETDILKRTDPVYVSRTITAMVNSNDDRGILSGCWDGNYIDGVSPTRWTGSVPILRRWSEGGTKSVCYGQCWVFSAVACTILRCLGIPTRCVTNYKSAHDTDGNINIDLLINKGLEPQNDSIWNFHCWVDSWMRREDLPKGYDGWQVLDPTPQERSDGVFCCGPCPVRAVKEGDLEMKYDVPFVFSEVNADVIYWFVHSNGTRTQASLDSSTVGKNISTKSAHGEYREDITAEYKYPEGSMKEREVYAKAGKRVAKENRDPHQLQLSIKYAQAVYGTDFDVIVEVQNVSGEDTSAQLTITSSAVTYNGLHRGECQRKRADLTIPAQRVHKEVIRLLYDRYGACMSEHNLIRVTALLQTSSPQKVFFQEVNIPLNMPRLQVEVIGEAVVSRNLTAKISFANPLPVALQRGVFTLEGSALTEEKVIQIPEAIGQGKQIEVNIPFIPTRAGLRKLLVDFDSDRLRDVKGEATIIVQGCGLLA
ncbi:protein-glutamine gamma-glutamyltransferase 2-like [Hoplias malabaricus]|uniref:protein-glutamine gamma-glutamyltransferase 2-like n=1 Tax=Hoplias malabaricus TaxID=27720 RepID=UPI0034630C82